MQYNFNVKRSADSNQIAYCCYVVYLVKVEFFLCFLSAELLTECPLTSVLMKSRRKKLTSLI